MSEHDGNTQWSTVTVGKYWALEKVEDMDYKPPKHLWWSLHSFGENLESIVLSKRLTLEQVLHIVDAFNKAEEIK